MSNELRILIVEDSESDAELILHELNSKGFKIKSLRVENALAMRQALEQTWDIILSDFRLPQFNAITALEELQRTGKDIPFIIVSQAIGEGVAVELMRAGAADYVMKSSLKRLAPAVEREVKEAQVRAEARKSAAALAESEKKFRLLAENSADFISRHRLDGTTTYVSPAFTREWGYKESDLIGKSPYDFGHPDDIERIQAEVATLCPGKIVRFENRIRRADGKFIWLETILRLANPVEGDVDGEIIASARDITARKEAEARIAEQQLFLNSVIANQINGVLVIEPDGGIRVANASAIRTLDLRHDAQSGQLKPADELQRVDLKYQPLPEEQQPVYRALRGETITSFEYGIMRPDGRIIWLSLSAAPIRNAGGQITAAVVSFIDISEAMLQRRQAAKQIEQLRLQAEAINSSMSGVIIADARMADLPVIFVNKAFSQITGYEPEDVLGVNCRFLHGQDKHQPELERMRRALRDKVAGQFNLRNYRKDGSIFHCQLNLAPVQNDDGVVTHFVAIQTDITQRKRMEEDLRMSWERQRLALNGAKLGLIDFDYEERRPYYNSRMGEILGYPAEDLTNIHESWWHFVHPEDREHAEQLANGHLSGQTDDIEAELRLQHRDGHWVWILGRGRVVERTEEGKPKRFVGTVLDISAQKQQTERIRELSQQLIDLAEIERSEISGELHDVVGQSLVLAKLNLLKFLAEHNLRSEENEQRILAPVTATLDKVREISRRLTPSHMKKVGLALAVEDMLESAQDLSGIKIHGDVAALDDFFPENWNIPCYRIIQEAVTNALKHAHATEIRVSAFRMDSNLDISITDNGHGLDDETDQHGIGLSLMRERVRGLKGQLFFESDPGGLTIRAVIPRPQTDK